MISLKLFVQHFYIFQITVCDIMDKQTSTLELKQQNKTKIRKQMQCCVNKHARGANLPERKTNINTNFPMNPRFASY